MDIPAYTRYDVRIISDITVALLLWNQHYHLFIFETRGFFMIYDIYVIFYDKIVISCCDTYVMP